MDRRNEDAGQEEQKNVLIKLSLRENLNKSFKALYRAKGSLRRYKVNLMTKIAVSSETRRNRSRHMNLSGIKKFTISQSCLAI